MATYNKKYKGKEQTYNRDSGNKTVLSFQLKTDSSGKLDGAKERGSDLAALTSGDIVRLGVLPMGFELHDCLGVCHDVGVASSTIALGFAYVDGVDDSDVPQDDDYFYAAFSLNAANRTRANNTAVKPVTLPKDAYLIATHSAHTQNVVLEANFHIEGVMQGPQG